VSASRRATPPQYSVVGSCSYLHSVVQDLMFVFLDAEYVLEHVVQLLLGQDHLGRGGGVKDREHHEDRRLSTVLQAVAGTADRPAVSNILPKSRSGPLSFVGRDPYKHVRRGGQGRGPVRDRTGTASCRHEEDGSSRDHLGRGGRLALRTLARVVVATKDLVELGHPRAEHRLLAQSVDLRQTPDPLLDVVLEHLHAPASRVSVASPYGQNYKSLTLAVT